MRVAPSLVAAYKDGLGIVTYESHVGWLNYKLLDMLIPNSTVVAQMFMDMQSTNAIHHHTLLAQNDGCNNNEHGKGSIGH